jgi:hypothetical protein
MSAAVPSSFASLPFFPSVSALIRSELRSAMSVPSVRAPPGLSWASPLVTR